MIEAVRTSETSVDNQFTRQYIPEDNSEHHTRSRENLKSHNVNLFTSVTLTTTRIHMSLISLKQAIICTVQITVIT
jgi:hypothetical protein